MPGQCEAQISSVKRPASRHTSGVLAAGRVTFERDVLDHLQHRLAYLRLVTVYRWLMVALRTLGNTTKANVIADVVGHIVEDRCRNER